MEGSKPRVLLIDDDPDVRWAVARCLVQADFSVMTCDDGDEAIAAMEGIPFDIVVTDIQMPRLNGLAVIDWIRQNHPSIRVVVITAFGTPVVREVCLRKGAILYLEKPVDTDLLIDILHSSDNADSFSGSVGDIDLFDYVQLMLVTKRQMVLEVSSRDGERGTLYLEGGNVLHAVCGEEEGEEAFYRCLSFKGGSFSTLPWREVEHHSVARPGHFLLMEAARKKDEARRDQESPLEGESGSDEWDEELDGLWNEG